MRPVVFTGAQYDFTDLCELHAQMEKYFGV